MKKYKKSGQAPQVEGSSEEKKQLCPGVWLPPSFILLGVWPTPVGGWRRPYMILLLYRTYIHIYMYMYCCTRRALDGTTAHTHNIDAAAVLCIQPKEGGGIVEGKKKTRVCWLTFLWCNSGWCAHTHVSMTCMIPVRTYSVQSSRSITLYHSLQLLYVVVLL